MNNARFHHREQVAADMITFWFSTTRSFRYTAGQFIELRFIDDTLDERHKKRWFTLSSSPTEELLAVTTRMSDSPSNFKQHLTSLKKGDEMLISEPMGDFILPRNSAKPLLFIVGGIGVTPVRSILTYLKDTGEQRAITILNAVRDITEIPYVSLLKEMSIYEAFASSQNKRLSAEKIRQAAASLDNPIIYISGPEPMVEAYVKELQDTFDQRQLITDYFLGYEPL